MRKHTIASLSECRALQDADTRLNGYPRAGTDENGKPVEPGNPGGRGWTMQQSAIQQHPKDERTAYHVSDAMDEALLDPDKRKRCTSGELAALDAASAAAAKLPNDWVNDSAALEND